LESVIVDNFIFGPVQNLHDWAAFSAGLSRGEPGEVSLYYVKRFLVVGKCHDPSKSSNFSSEIDLRNLFWLLIGALNAPGQGRELGRTILIPLYYVNPFLVVGNRQTRRKSLKIIGIDPPNALSAVKSR